MHHQQSGITNSQASTKVRHHQQSDITNIQPSLTAIIKVITAGISHD
jgi:hypothetical protein